MKKLLKLLFWLLISALVAWTLTSCKKTEYVEPEKTWFLSLAAPSLGYSVENMPCKAIGKSMGQHNVQVGVSIDFDSERFTARIYTEGADNRIVQWTGFIDGVAYGIVGNTMGVCGGAQDIQITYSLKYK